MKEKTVIRHLSFYCFSEPDKFRRIRFTSGIALSARQRLTCSQQYCRLSMAEPESAGGSSYGR